MAYWIFENGETIGPFRAIEILEIAKPETLLKEEDRWVRLDQHRNFSMLDFQSTPQESTASTSAPESTNGTEYWIFKNMQSLGPLNAQEVLRLARPDTLVSHNQTWLPLQRHPDFDKVESAVQISNQPEPVAPKDAPSSPPDIEPKPAQAQKKKKSPRVRRLERDHERVSSRFDGWPLINVDFAGGSPPDTYRVSYKVKGLYATREGDLLERDEHVVEIKLGLQYPRRPPQCKLLTPLFHPNFNNTDVCAQDNYAASEGLDDLIVRIGRMIAYQEYNTKSPLNGIAAKWAEDQRSALPVDRREISPPSGSEAGESAAQTDQPRAVAG